MDQWEIKMPSNQDTKPRKKFYGSIIVTLSYSLITKHKYIEGWQNRILGEFSKTTIWLNLVFRYPGLSNAQRKKSPWLKQFIQEKKKTKITNQISSTLLQLHTNHLLPRVSGRYLAPPPTHILSGSEELTPISGAHQVLRIGQVRKIGQREFIAGQELGLAQPLLVHVKHLGQPFLVLFDRHLVLLDLHSRRERKLKHQSRAWWAEALPLRLKPLVYGCFCQWVRPIQSFVSLVRVLLTNVSAYRPRLWINYPQKNSYLWIYILQRRTKLNEDDKIVAIFTKEGDALVFKCWYLAKGLLK